MSLLLLVVGGGLAMAPGDLSAQAAGQWVVPRTEHGHPDLQGNWTNATMTPVQRPPGQERALSAEQVAQVEGTQAAFVEEQIQDSDPDREAPPVGGIAYGQPLLDAASGGTGGYNFFFIDPGSRVAVYDGEARSSLVTTPESGRIPPLTPQAQQRIGAQMAAARRFGEFDNPENRPIADRCIMSFGSNAGPPMLPNYFYNNNYTIVQTADHVMIMTEMVHDFRIIPLGERPNVPDHITPWMGNSWGYWAGDTLVVETTRIRPEQLGAGGYVLPGGGSEDFRVIERLTRAGENTINYEFTVIDPATYTLPWGGQVPFVRQPGQVYEYACHEGNYAMINILSGARAEERRAAAGN